jgi:transposase
VDLRAGFEKLSMIIRDKLEKDVATGDLYLFLGKNKRRMKGLCFDGTGLLLITKRLERGTFMRLSEFESLEITPDELDSLLRGSLIIRNKFGIEALTKQNSHTIV